MNERKFGNSRHHQIPAVFVEAFPNGFSADSIPGAVTEIDELVSTINKEFIARMLKRKDYIDYLNAW